MKGWVYVITNQAMPGLVKVGYSTKDPELRAGELNHTGSPHAYLVEYELLIDETDKVEQGTHRFLSSKREAKEWFRCSPEEAIVAIKQIAGSGAIFETYNRADREKAQALHQQQLRKKADQLKQQQAEQEIENRFVAGESAIRQKYQQHFDARFPPRPFWTYWLGGSILALIGISMMRPKASYGGAFILAAIGGAILGAILQGYFEKERKQSSSYILLEKQRDEAVSAVRLNGAGDVSIKIETSNNLSANVRAKLKKFVGAEVDEVEIARCTQRVERVISGLVTTVDCRKIAISTKVKMAVNAPKQNVINMITNSYPGTITDRMAASIFDALAEL